MSKPQSQRSSRWAFMERFEVPDLDHPERTYLSRLRIVQTPWCALYLHRMDTPDSRPTLHDHPWSFVSFVLRGGYVEQRLNLKTRAVERKHRRRLNVMRRDDAHYIERLDRTPTWTLLFVGARRRTWGYWRARFDHRASWTWTPFDTDFHAEEFDAAMAAREATT